MLNGLKNFYINGVDWMSKIQPGATITDSFDVNVCEFEVMATEAEVTFTPKAPLVRVIDKDDNELFIGKLTRPQALEYKNGDYIQWKMIAQGYRNLYRNIPVSKEFKTVAADQIFTELVENDDYIGSTDLVGTVIDYTDELDMNFTTNLTEAFDSLADAVLDNEGAMWTVTYNTGSSKVEHNLVWKFDNKIDDIKDVATDSMKPPTDDISSVKNIYKFTANDVLFPEQGVQDYPIFGASPDMVYDLDNNIQLCLPGNCINIRLFLVVGTPSTDAIDYHRENIKEIPIVLTGVDATSQSTITVDPNDFLSGKIKTLMPESLANTNGELTSLNFFQATLNKQPLDGIPESKYGYITVPDRNYLWAAFSQGLEPIVKTQENLLCYRIYYYRKENYTQVYKDDSSIASYGYQLQTVQMDNVPDVRWLEAYATRLLQSTAWPTKAGQYTVLLWSDDTRYYADNPHAGDYCDVSFTKGDKTITLSDCYIYEAKYQFTAQKMHCTITTKQIPYGNRNQLELEKIKRALAALNNKGNVEYKTIITLTDTVNLDSDCFETILTKSQMIWGNDRTTEELCYQA